MSGSAIISVGPSTPHGVGELGIKRNKRNRAEPGLPHSVRVLTNVTYGLIAIMLAYVLSVRREGHITAESGIGYALGIAGVAATVALLIYPLRKRIRWMSHLGSTAVWFHFHMLLGILAPALILAHCNFRFGSLNSSIALISMLLVAGSGFVGRHIYGRIHFSLYGTRATVDELRSIISDDADRIGMVLSFTPTLRDRLSTFAERTLTPRTNIVSAAIRILTIGIRVRWLRFTAFFSLQWNLAREAKVSGWSDLERKKISKQARQFIRGYLGNVRKAVQLSFFDRLFALWHVLHIPLFFMLLIATSVHIVAVHMY